MRRAVKRLLSRYRKWKEWRIYTGIGKFRQFCVLLGIEKNSHFEWFHSKQYVYNNTSRRKSDDNENKT